MDDLHRLLDNLDEESITYVKSFLLKIILKSHPRYKELLCAYPKTILSYIIPKDDLEMITYPQNTFFSQDFITHQQRYDLDSVYSLVTLDAGVKCLPEDIIPNIAKGNIIDGGCYNGETSLVFTDYTPHTVYSFEPIHKHVAVMQKKINAFNKQDQVKVISYGIGDKDSSFAIDDETSSGFTSFVWSKEASTTTKDGDYLAKLTSIDNFIEKHHVDNISMIKLDIQGYEQPAIQGMKKLLKRDKPILLMSIYHFVDDFIRIKDTLNKMNLGYKFSIRHIDPLNRFPLSGPSTKCNCDFSMFDEDLHSAEYMLFAY